MPGWDDWPLHDFPDRAIRHLLADPRNLQELMTAVDPHLSGALDFSQVRHVDRSFLLDDWRRREADLLFHVPFRSLDQEKPALICILIEHQSAPDPRMPLRLLLYAVLYWEREWRAWEDDHARRQPLRLSPILPVVFHTGPQPWPPERDLASLIPAPEPLRAYIPQWRTLLWDLAEQSPGSLVESASAWLRELAVIRAEGEETDAFAAIYAAVVSRLGEVGADEEMRRQGLLWFALSWALLRRPKAEQAQWLAIARDAQPGVKRREEVDAMAEVIAGSWQAEMLEQIEERGRQARQQGLQQGLQQGIEQGLEQGRTEGELAARRDILRTLLEERFGPLPQDRIQRIEGCSDMGQLKEWIRQAMRIQSPEELDG